MQRFAHSPTMLWLLIAAATLASAAGCVRRRMTIRTNPPGAMVYIDEYEVGTTPVSTEFTYYGDRKIRLVKDGYETATFIQPVRAPWYQWPVIDFFAETFSPHEIRDQQVFDYQLRPQRVVPTDELLQRAEGLRRKVQPAGFNAPAASSAPANPAMPVPPPAATGPEMFPTPTPAPPQPAPSGVGGQPVYPLPPSGR